MLRFSSGPAVRSVEQELSCPLESMVYLVVSCEGDKETSV